MPLNRPLLLSIAALLLDCSCATRRFPPTTLGTSCALAGSTLAENWQALNEARRTPGVCDKDRGITCDAIRAKIERLAVDCPNNPQVIFANAILAFDARNLARAQQLLDEFMNLGQSIPDAAVLRARIALEQGNLPFALRMLEQQIHETGDHAGLRETYASALYLTSRWNETKEQLIVAQRLGAPTWRIAYGLGLIEEARGSFETAKQQYRESLRDKPGWRPAESRLRALAATGKISKID